MLKQCSHRAQIPVDQGGKTSQEITPDLRIKCKWIFIRLIEEWGWKSWELRSRKTSLWKSTDPQNMLIHWITTEHLLPLSGGECPFLTSVGWCWWCWAVAGTIRNQAPNYGATRAQWDVKLTQWLRKASKVNTFLAKVCRQLKFCETSLYQSNLHVLWALLRTGILLK